MADVLGERRSRLQRLGLRWTGVPRSPSHAVASSSPTGVPRLDVTRAHWKSSTQIPTGKSRLRRRHRGGSRHLAALARRFASHRPRMMPAMMTMMTTTMATTMAPMTPPDTRTFLLLFRLFPLFDPFRFSRTCRKSNRSELWRGEVQRAASARGPATLSGEACAALGASMSVATRRNSTVEIVEAIEARIF